MQSDQIENGSWVAWPETRPPFFGGSDDSMSALAALALVPAADDAGRMSLERGLKWLSATPTDDDPQSLAIRLILFRRASRSQAEWETLVQKIRDRQNADGGWSQAKDMPSDAWATGQALYALSHAVKSDDPALDRGRSFLVKTQREDGSWLMTSRPTKPGDAGGKNLIPITGGGSSWGVIGLARAKP